MSQALSFINPIHKLVQIDIARKISAAGQPNMIECTGMNGIFPDICTPGSPPSSAIYRHAEVKPSYNWIMAITTDALAELQLKRRDRWLLDRLAMTPPLGRAIAVVSPGWPTVGTVTAGPLVINWRYEKPGLYLYKTNFGELALSYAAALALTKTLRDLKDINFKNYLDDLRLRFPKPADPVMAFLKGVGDILVATVLIGGAAVVVVGGAAAIASAGGATAVASAAVGSVGLGGVAWVAGGRALAFVGS